MEKYEKALESFQKSLGTEDNQLEEKTYYNIGNTYFQQNNLVESINAYKKALDIDPNDKDAKYNLELALKQQQQQEQQQQQQQQGGGGGQPPPPDQEQQGEGDQEQENQGQGEQEQEDQQGGGNEPEQDDQGQGGQQPQDPGRGLTPQEAEQLLDALGQDSQTLQERLQQGFFAPGMPPTEDW